MGALLRRTGRSLRALQPAPVVVVAALAALSGWEATLSRYSTPAHWGVLAVIAAAVLGALVAGRRRQRMHTLDWVGVLGRALGGPASWRQPWPAPLVAGAIIWTALAAAAIGWDLYSFLVQAHQLPTLSRLFGDVTDRAWGRGLVFAAWAALGCYLAVGWRQPAGPRDATRTQHPVDGAVPVADGRR